MERKAGLQMAKFAVHRGFTHDKIRYNRGESIPDSLKEDSNLCDTLYKKGLLAKVRQDGTLMRWLVPVHDFKTVPPHAKKDYAQHLIDSGQIDPESVPEAYRTESDQTDRPRPGRPRKEDTA